jgi:hypothetical protein
VGRRVAMELVLDVRDGPVRSAHGAILSMSLVMATGTKSYEILSRIITQSAPPLDVMDLKIFHSPARLTTPAVSFENFPAELAISFWLKS